MGHSVDTYKPLDRGEAFGEQFITITQNFLSECFALLHAFFASFVKHFYWTGSLGGLKPACPSI
jgi:hypothetical protein